MVRHVGADLTFRVFDKLQTVGVGAVVENERLSEVLAHMKAQQAAFPDSKRRGAAGRVRTWKHLARHLASAPAPPLLCARHDIIYRAPVSLQHRADSNVIAQLRHQRVRTGILEDILATS